MKFKNIIRTSLLSVIMALNLVSCDSDIDPVYVLPTDTISLGGASGDIVLTPDNPQALATVSYTHLTLPTTP